MKFKKIIVLSILLSLGLLPALPALAKIGVGVGLGKIVIDEPLLPGGIYKLPTIPVLNTGDETSTYEMDVTYQHEQPELRPAKEWFIFTPQPFDLDGGGSQPVEVRLSLPLKVEPGDYFAYLEAHPVTTGEGGVTIGIAAATKIWFTVKPANTFQAIIHKITSFVKNTAPTSYIVMGIIGLIILILLFKKFFSFNLSIKKKPSEPKTKPENNNEEPNSKN